MSGSMCDATCARCGKRIGWAGEPKDQPPCPRCGGRPDPEALARDQAEFERWREAGAADGPESRSGKTEAVWLQDWEPGTYVYVGRWNRNFPDESGMFGNPFSANPRAVGTVTVGSLEQAVNLYRRWIEGDPSAAAMLTARESGRRVAILSNLPSLRGKRLGCWRHTGPCHARVLAELADGPLGEPRAQEANSDGA